MNNNNLINYNSKKNSNNLNYTSPANPNINTNNNIKNNNGNKQNLFYIQKIEEEPQLRINTVINTIGASYNISSNYNILNKNKKNMNNSNSKLISCLTGWTMGYKGAIKGYNTTNNTANNSVTGSMEKIDNKNFNNKKYKKNSNNKKYGKDILKSKDLIKKINNNIEFNLIKNQNKKIKYYPKYDSKRKIE